MEQTQPRTYLITGASGVLGSHVARLLVEQGQNVCLVGRKKQKLEDLRASFTGTGNMLLIEADLTEQAAGKEIIEQVVQHFGELDGLVHLVGGFARPAPCQSTPLPFYQRLLSANFLTAVTITQPAIEHLVPGGSLLYMSSFLAHDPIEGMSAYAASKAALVAWVKTMARELRDRAHVNVISTVAMESPHSHAALSPDTDKGKNKNILTPPAELAQIVLFMLSDQSKRIHGATIPVYGSFYLENTSL